MQRGLQCRGCGEYKKEEKYKNFEDAIAAAVGSGDLDEIHIRMIEALDEIPEGYFADEMLNIEQGETQ